MKLKGIFWAAMLMVSFQIFVALPLLMWTRNQFNFTAQPVESLNLFLVFFLLSVVLATLIAAITPKKLLPLFIPLSVAFGIIIYLQQNVLVWDYGILDGSELPFKDKNLMGVLELGIWGGLFFGAVKFKEKILKHTGTLLLFTAIMTGVSFVPNALSALNASSTPTMSITEKNKFTLSTDKNIIVLNLDAYQSDLFWEHIDSEPELKSKFDGFTFYPNTTSSFSKTYPSIPAILTGKRYQKKEPIFEFINNAYSDSVLADLKTAGWNVELYPYDPATIALSDKVADNAVGGVKKSEKIVSYLRALDLSLFRAAPHFLKPFIYSDGNFFVKPRLTHRLVDANETAGESEIVRLTPLDGHSALSFAKQSHHLGQAGSTKPSFRFYPLLIPHAPFTLDRNLNKKNMGTSFEAYQEYSKAAVVVTLDYLQSLKDKGVYDNSAILILSDHGGSMYNNKQYDPQTKSYKTIKSNGYHRASARSLMLVKGFGETGDMKISNAPVSILDAAPTVASFAKLKPTDDLEGRPIQTLTEATKRERIFSWYAFTGWDSKYLDDFHNYKITGNVRDEAAWEKLDLQGPQIKIENKATYDIARTITFGTDIKNDTDYQNAFIAPDIVKVRKKDIESNADGITVNIPLTAKLNPDIVYAISYKVSTSNVDTGWLVNVDDLATERFTTAETPSERTYFFKGSDVNNSKQVAFSLARADTGSNGAVRIGKLTIAPAVLSPLPETGPVKFGEVVDNYYLSGFSWRSWWGRYTKEVTASASFLAPATLCQNHDLDVSLKEFAPTVTIDEFKVAINGQELSRLGVTETEKGPVIRYDCADVLDDTFNKIEFKTDKVVTPSKVSDSDDHGVKGVAIYGFEFVAQ